VSSSLRRRSQSAVLYEDKPVLQAVKDLMTRELSAEFESL
jgi:hypothetical protein